MPETGIGYTVIVKSYKPLRIHNKSSMHPTGVYLTDTCELAIRAL